MAIEYVYTTINGDITVKWLDGAITSEIHIEDSISTLLVQDLLDAIRAAEDSPIGVTFGQIANADGKKSLGGGVATGITIELLGDWLIYSTKVSGVFRVTGGNLIRYDESDPFRPNNLITYLNIQSAAATIVTASSGGGAFTDTDRTNLETDLANGEEALVEIGVLDGKTDSLETAVASLQLDVRALKAKGRIITKDDTAKKLTSLEGLLLDLEKKVRRLTK